MTAELRAMPPAVGEDARIARALAIHADVPPRFLECRLDAFEPRKGTQRALAAARRLVDDAGAGQGLLLSGPPGTGKTHLAVGILAARVAGWLERWPQAVVEHPAGGVVVRPELDATFVVVPTLLDRLRAGVEYRDAEDPLPALIRAQLLVLDDLGREKSTDWVLERLYVLVNERYNHRRPTIVTTNFTPQQLNHGGYDALVSRLVDAAEVVRIDAGDYRAAGR